jgi:hypothetical protein
VQHTDAEERYNVLSRPGQVLVREIHLQPLKELPDDHVAKAVANQDGRHAIEQVCFLNAQLDLGKEVISL